MCGMFCIFANVNDKMTANIATDKTAYWLDIANEDLEVAEDLFKTKRWLYVAFMCHQVIEKTFKVGMINNMNIEARYPDYKTGIARSLSEQKCREIIDKTKQMQQWIIQESLPETKPSSSSETTSE